MDERDERQMILKKAGKEDFLNFCEIINPNYEVNWHHRVIATKLQEAYEKLLRGIGSRIVIEMPPRHGKSLEATILFPAWVLGNKPEWPVIVSSYSADLVETFGMLTRDVMSQNDNYKALFKTRLRADTKAKAIWMTDKGGGYTAAGIGGSITGKGFKIGIIDDFVKNREEADSEVYRDKNWDWFRSTFYTRQDGASIIIVIACMTGDTPVLLADGTEKPLRDIRIGDDVATYKNGELTTSVVKNWISNGFDSVFTIKTFSGKIVKANKRHPFLIYDNGKPKWISTKNLRPGQEIFRVNGENGKGKFAYGKDVIIQSSAEDSVHTTITKNDGQMGLDHLLLIANHFVRLVLNTATGLLRKNIILFFLNKTGSVQFVNNCPEKMFAHTGGANFALTIATKQEKSGLFSVMTAILLSVMQKLQKWLWLRLNTSDFILDKIVEITPAGVEEVFDVQIEDTENFIANGLVSHNTRWHLDDLIGRIEAQEELMIKSGVENYDEWEYISFPAIAEENEEHRKKGEALWPNRISLDQLKQIESTLGIYEFSSLYQQKPIPSEKQLFKKEWFKYYEPITIRDLGCEYYTTVDPGGEDVGNDNNAVITVAKSRNSPNWYRVEETAGQFDPGQLIDAIFYHRKKYRSHIWLETIQYQKSLKFFIQERQRKEGLYFVVNELKNNQIKSKESRIKGLVPLYQAGVIYHLKDDLAYEGELLSFPKGKKDDRLDAMASMLEAIQNTDYDDREYPTEEPNPDPY